MNKKINEKIKDTKQYIEGSLEDYFESIQSFKGADFCNIVRYLSGGMHTTKILAMAMQDAPEHMQAAAIFQFSSVANQGALTMFSLAKLTEKDIEEAMDWAEKISETIDHGMEQLDSFMNKENGNEA